MNLISNRSFCLNQYYSTTRNVVRGSFSKGLRKALANSKLRAGGLMLKGYLKESYPGLPLISVITVTFNAEHFLEKTLLSVIEQDYENVEYIIIDGGSTDTTLEILSKHESHIDLWISEKDRNMYDAMNKGIQLSSGEYLNFLNASDYYCDNAVLSNLFRNCNNADVVYGDIYIIDEVEKSTTYQKAKDLTRANLAKHSTATVNHQALFVKKDIAPMYNIRFQLKAELNWYYDILEKIRSQDTICYKELPIVYYRRGGIGDNIFWRQLFEFITINYQRLGILSLATKSPCYSMTILNHFKANRIYSYLKSTAYRSILFLNKYRFFHLIFKYTKNALIYLGIFRIRDNA
jgi:glycosyltransferase involved in cell wall biosynthesis